MHLKQEGVILPASWTWTSRPGLPGINTSILGCEKDEASFPWGETIASFPNKPPIVSTISCALTDLSEPQLYASVFVVLRAFVINLSASSTQAKFLRPQYFWYVNKYSSVYLVQGEQSSSRHVSGAITAVNPKEMCLNMVFLNRDASALRLPSA